LLILTEGRVIAVYPGVGVHYIVLTQISNAQQKFESYPVPNMSREEHSMKRTRLHHPFGDGRSGGSANPFSIAK
jgi:hypothetical protein